MAENKNKVRFPKSQGWFLKKWYFWLIVLIWCFLSYDDEIFTVELFLAGFIFAFIKTTLIFMIIYVIAKKKNYKKEKF